MTNCAHDYTTLGLDIARHLHDQGVTLAPDADQRAGGPLPAVFVGPMDDEPDSAMSIVGPWQDVSESGSDDSMVVRFMVAARSAPWDLPGLSVDTDRLHQALHRRDPFALTATQTAMYCTRIVSDPPVQDENNRWRQVTTYSARLNPPDTPKH